MEPPFSQTGQRKTDHLTINLQQDVRSRRKSGFENLHFIHQALPELSYDEICLETVFLDKTLQAPFLISSMTGGTEQAQILNIRLARAAQSLGIAMALGSMRILLEEPALLPTFQVRAHAPDVMLFANLGAIQLNKGVTEDNCQHLVDVVQADALVLHLNPLQEILQPEGDTNWKNLLHGIEKVVKRLSVPLIIKEVGYGLSPRVIYLLKEIGVHGFDVAGAGGTSWSQVESYRAGTPLLQRIAQGFQEWGIPTVTSLMWAHTLAPDRPLIASGGLRSGIDAAKAIHLGAHLCGIAHPLLKAANISEEALIEELAFFVEQLKITMMCTASRTLEDLRGAEVMWEGMSPHLPTSYTG